MRTAELQARALEELNALYVALTRAEERLVISSCEPHQRGNAASWYQRLQQPNRVRRTGSIEKW